ncbi:MAG TPA: hypothetical protein QF873_00965 [Patescibacteria group bacterium]|nr:hypothetical protein [Patescibacteria group bacterium]
MTTKNKKRRESKSISLWNGVCVLALLVIGTAYVFQMSSVTQRGYQMRELELAVEDLELEGEQLKVNVAESTSLANVSERMKILGFTEPSEITYISGLDSVAIR